MICEWDTARFLIFSDNGIPLLYYSHLTAIVIFVALLALTFLRSRPWPKTAFRVMVLSYIVWLAGDLVLWGNEKMDHVMFFWTIVNLVEPLIFAAAYAHFISFTENRLLNSLERGVIILLLLPTAIMAPLGFSVVGFDYTTCDRNAVEGIAAYYNYFLEAMFILLILLQAVKRLFIVRHDRLRLSRLVLATVSLALLLTSFLFANFFGTYFVAYEISQLGHVAVPVFAAMLAFITIKFDTFQPRVLIIDVFTSALIVLVISLLFVRSEDLQGNIVFITLLLLVPLAYSLMTGIRKEVRAREHIEKLADQLQEANAGQAQLIHFINHQIKGFFNKAQIVFTELLTEKDYGEIPEPAKKMLMEGENSVKEGVSFVQQILKASDIEKGTYAYDMQPIDFSALVREVGEEMQTPAREKGLKYSLNISEGAYNIRADKNQLREAVRNLIDNSIRYTPDGSIEVSLSSDKGKIRFKVKDTGVGLSDEVKKKLFTKGGHGKDSQKINVNSTGYGLSIVKGIVLAHKGCVWADSAGPGKGSTFYLELPA